MTDPDIALILRAYAAFQRGDIDAAVVDLHEDVEWTEPEHFPHGGTRHGPAAVHEYLAAARAHWRELTSMPMATRVGDTIEVRHHVTGVPVDGTAHTAEVIDAYTVVGGRVTRMVARELG
jgi:ketosteroid isomerase-like protein